MKQISFALTLLLALAVLTSPAQNKNTGRPVKISPSDFKLPESPAIDSNSNAVILYDIGNTEFVGNKKGWFNYVFKRHTRIQILNKKSFELATVKIPVYTNDNDREVVSEVAATTYNLDNNQVVETRLDKTDLFTSQLDKNHQEQKFTMPAVREGSIIEYSYTITSGFIFNIPSWEFQNINYPCLWSDYQVTIPGLLIYMSRKYGVHPYYINKSDEGHEIYSIVQPREKDMLGLEDKALSVNTSTMKQHWVMKDLPAFYVENYLSSPVNYLDRISFQLHQTYNGETTRDVMTTWAKATDELMKQEDFAAFMNEDESGNYWMNDALSGIGNGTTALQQAKSVYYYITGNFTCNNHYNRNITTTLKDVYKKHIGSVGDINLLLAALLKRKGIHVSPVLLSTREHGYNYPSYPVMDVLNYVICRAEIDGHVYFLDASHPNLGFGNLPANCYNGHARIISRTDSASIYFLPDSIRERKLTMVTLSADEANKGGLVGSIQSNLGPMESYALRERIAARGERQFFAELKTTASGEADITNTWIDSLKEPEKPITLHEEFKMKSAEDAGIIYLNPVMVDAYRKNPFAAADRKYPVEMEYPINSSYYFTMEIPAGYEVEELPKMAKVSYNEGEGFFEYLIQKGQDNIQLRCSLVLKKANFDPEDYNSLRDFFAFVVKKQNEQIVLKKKQ